MRHNLTTKNVSVLVDLTLKKCGLSIISKESNQVNVFYRKQAKEKPISNTVPLCRDICISFFLLHLTMRYNLIMKKFAEPQTYLTISVCLRIVHNLWIQPSQCLLSKTSERKTNIKHCNFMSWYLHQFCSYYIWLWGTISLWKNLLSLRPISL